MGTPIRVGYGARRHVAVDACDGHGYAAEHGAGVAPVGTRHFHRAVAHPHPGPARALDDVDVVEHPVTEEDDDFHLSRWVRALQRRLQPAPLGRRVERVGERRKGIRRAQQRPAPGRDEIRRACVPWAALGGLHGNRLGPGRREEHRNRCQRCCQHCARTRCGCQHGRPTPQQPGCPPPGHRAQGAERGARPHAPGGDAGVHLVGQGADQAGDQTPHPARPPRASDPVR